LHTTHLNRVRFRHLLVRALRLRCPTCGRGALFRNLVTMHERCSRCGLLFEREPGYFLGSIYINYGMTTLIGLVAYFIASLGFGVTGMEVTGPLIGFALLFPVFFHRYARSLWLGFDHFIDPPPPVRGPSRPGASGL
jgi:hypothetical protein